MIPGITLTINGEVFKRVESIDYRAAGEDESRGPNKSDDWLAILSPQMREAISRPTWHADYARAHHEALVKAYESLLNEVPALFGMPAPTMTFDDERGETMTKIGVHPGAINITSGADSAPERRARGPVIVCDSGWDD